MYVHMRYLLVCIFILKYAKENILKTLILATEQKIAVRAGATVRNTILFWMRYSNKSKLLTIYFR